MLSPSVCSGVFSSLFFPVRTKTIAAHTVGHGPRRRQAATAIFRGKVTLFVKKSLSGERVRALSGLVSSFFSASEPGGQSTAAPTSARSGLTGHSQRQGAGQGKTKSQPARRCPRQGTRAAGIRILADSKATSRDRTASRETRKGGAADRPPPDNVPVGRSDASAPVSRGTGPGGLKERLRERASPRSLPPAPANPRWPIDSKATAARQTKRTPKPFRCRRPTPRDAARGPSNGPQRLNAAIAAPCGDAGHKPGPASRRDAE